MPISRTSALLSSSWVLPRASDFTWFDPGAILASIPVQNAAGTGITISLLGANTIASTVQPDFGSGAAYGIAPLLDAYGSQVTGDVEFSTSGRIKIIGVQPTVNDNLYAALGLVNESDISTVTVDGGYSILDMSAAIVNPRVRSATLSNGAISLTTNGTAAATIAALRNSMFRHGQGGGVASGLAVATTYGLDSSDGTVNGVNTPASGASSPGTSVVYLFFGVARSLIGDIDPITFDFAPQYQPIITVIA